MRFPRLTASSVKIISVFSFVLALAACSDSSNNSNRQEPKIDAYVEAGNGDIEGAHVLVTAILTDGRLDKDNEGRRRANTAITQADKSTYIAAQDDISMHLIEVLSSTPNASFARCQWVENCNAGEVKFAEKIIESYRWRSAVWRLENNQHISVTPLTELAAALAENFIYHESNNFWYETDHYYSPQGLVQSVSQVTQLFGFDSSVGDIQSIKPADLTSLNNLDIQNKLLAQESVRYGVLIAAWAYLAEEDDAFTSKVVEKLVEKKGQILQKSSNGEDFSLEKLYSAAIKNLDLLEEKYKASEVKPILTLVKNALKKDIERFEKKIDELTDIQPESLEKLLGESDNELYKNGLEEAKKMVDELNKAGQSLLFSEDYKNKLGDFKKAIDTLSNDIKGKENLDKLILQLIDVQEIYRLNKCADKADYYWLESCELSNNGELTLKTKDGGVITAKQEKVVGNSKATDIRIEGTFQVDGLQLKLKHKMNKEAVSEYSYVRVFADNKSDLEPLGFQLNWADFTLTETIDNPKEFNLKGSLSVMYMGVKDAENPQSKTHYNVDTLRIVGLLSKKSEYEKCTSADSDEEKVKDKECLNLDIELQSLKSNDYYHPTQQFGSFVELDKFFSDPSTTIMPPDDIPELLTYQTGEEILTDGRKVEYVDVRIEGGKSSRYRFYPTRKRDIIDNYGNKVGFNDTFDMSICSIVEKSEGKWEVEGTCSPRTQFQGERDVQKTMNDIWRTGSLSYVTVPNKGEFFVAWPANNKVEGCLNLDDLGLEKSFKGQGLEAAELGIDTLLLGSQIKLSGEKATTSYALQLHKPTSKRYEITSALSHDGETITVMYNTNSAFKRTGNFRISRKGVNVGLEGNGNLNLDIGLEQEISKSTLPHRYVIDNKGNQNVCITDNVPYEVDFEPNTAVYSLTFRGTVYGTIRKNGAVWEAKFVDGSPAVPMTNFNKFFEL